MRFIRSIPRIIRLAVVAFVAAALLVVVVPAAAYAVALHAVVVSETPGPDLEIPVLPVAVLTLIQIVSPYIVSLLAAFQWSANVKRAVAIGVSFVLAAALLVLSLLIGWIPSDFSPLGWVMLGLYGLGIQQAAYALILKPSADHLMESKGVGA